MTSFGTYFKFRFKSGLLRLIALSALIVIFVSICVGNSLVPPDSRNYPSEAPDVSILICAVIALVIALPILELSPLMNRRNLDTLYTLPVSRRKMALAHLLNAWLSFFTVYTLAYGVACCMWVSHYYEIFNNIWFIPLYFTLLGYGTLFLVFYTFVFSQANTVFDGIAFMVGWSFVFALFVSVVSDFLHLLTGVPERFTAFVQDYIDPLEESLICFMPLDSIGYKYKWVRIATYRPKDILGLPIYKESSFSPDFFVATVIWIIIAIAALAGYIYFFSKKKSEKAGGISDSPFGYKTLIPFFLCFLTMSWGQYDSVTSIVMLLCSAFVAYFVFRRSFKLKKWDIISIAVALAIGLLGVLALEAFEPRVYIEGVYYYN